MKKETDEFDFNKFVDEAIGQIIVSIGRGEIRGTIQSYMQTLSYRQFKAGCLAGRREAELAQRAKKRKC